MTTAIIIIVALGILDAMMFLGCTELERRQERYDERNNRKADK